MSVVPIREGALIPTVVEPPSEELIAKLEELLDAARSGYLRAIGYAMVDRDRGIGTGWAGRADHHDMTAGVNKLAFRYMSAGEDDEAD